MSFGRRLNRPSVGILIALLVVTALLMVNLSDPLTNADAAITLNWTPPSTNTNGTPLTDLAGYNVYYGTSSGNYTAKFNAGNVTSYTFTNLAAGTYYIAVTAYDTSGNQSVYSNEVVHTQLGTADTTLPTVAEFAVPSASTSLTIPITSFTATDNGVVTGYIITQSATPPATTASSWSATAPTYYTATAAGEQTLYAYAKDAAGNVSTGVSASVTITIPDTTSPTVTAFTVPATVSSLTVTVTLFTASDNIEITGYIITQSATPPTTTASGWSATAPTSYTATAAGEQTLYAYAKDAAGNVSTGVSAAVTVNLGRTTIPTEEAVFRPSDGNWYIMNSTTNTVTIVPWEHLETLQYLVTMMETARLM